MPVWVSDPRCAGGILMMSLHCLHELFEEQAARVPDALALVCGTELLSYAELNARANQLAHHLIEQGVGPDVPVAICVERSVELVFGLLAILKAGGAYVPLDPTYPQERLRDMLEDSSPALVLLQNATRAALGQVLDLPSVDVRADATLWGGHSRANPRTVRSGFESGHLVYIIYTSGSTGRPKGVMNEHRAVANRLDWMQREYGLRPQDRVLQKTPVSFDVSVWELFWPLLNGACLVMARPEGHRDPGYLGELIERERISVVHFVPSMLRSFIASGAAARCGSLRHVFCSGEELTTDLQNLALASLPQAGLHNLYGPTEAAIDVTYWACREQPADTRVPIGRPISNTRIYILDRDGVPVPPGTAGEICIGGLAVARGYWQRPELTAERFVSDSFSAQDGARMYRSGDLGCWRADGAIEYLGRSDTQVKIHGFRIELGEIEAALRRLAGVSQAVVLARESQQGEKRLVAYITPSEGEKPEAAGLREQLLKILPERMVPAAYVHLDTLPFTASGKLDRRALPAPELAAYATREYEPAQGECEAALASIWQELLDVERVGRRDNFFALGGHSLLALSLIERLRCRGMQIDLQALFTHTDLAGLAVSVRAGEQQLPAPDRSPLIVLEQGQIERIVAAVPGGAANVQEIYPLAPLQQGVLFHHLMQKEGDPYVLSSLLAFQSAQRLEEFLGALQAVIDRHDILRTGLVWEGLPEPVQVVWRHAPLSRLQVALCSQDGASELWERFDPRRHRLDVRRAPLFEAIEAYDAPQHRWLLLLLFHHLAVDHTSLEVIFSEVRAHLEGRQQQLPVPVPFRSFVAQALRAVPTSEREAFFTAMLTGIDEPTAPFDLLDVQGDGSGIVEAQQELDAGLAREIRACARAQRVSAATLCHLAWAQVLARLTGRADVVFGTVLFGRMQAGEGADRALGLFINTLPLRITVGEESVQESVRATHERLVQLLPHEHASLVTAQRCSAVTAPAPLFTTVLNYRYSRTPSFEQVDGRNWQGMQVLRSQERSNYPIALSVDDMGEGFRLTAQVQAALVPERLCGFMRRALEQLVGALTEHPHEAIRTLDVLPESERLQLASWSAGQASGRPAQAICPRESRLHETCLHEPCLHELFEAQVRHSPESRALVFEGQQVTFAELNAAANGLAHYLRARGVGPDVRVALCAEPSVELVSGLLGILKAGGAYVPLDPRYPLERLRYMLEDSAPALVLLKGSCIELGDAPSVPCVDLESDAALWRGQPATNPDAAAVGLRSGHLAYVIYTSGSTGQPKGVMGEHRGMVNRIVAQRWIAPFAADDVCCHKTAMGFVDSIFEILGPLCYGQPLVLAPRAVSQDSLQLARLVQREGITCLISVPSLAQALLTSGAARECLQGLRAWTLSGEELREDLLVSLRSALPSCRFVNLYGSSEIAADAPWYSAEDFEGGRVPIGSPLYNTRVYVLDALSRPVPIGTTGEIHVGGMGVARGYLNRPDLTTERFARDRFTRDPDARLYRTGDLGRWRPDGMLEYLGRRDQQVKIRGFRVELGEIEAALRRLPGVSEAAVLARDDERGAKRLVAYIAAPEGEKPQARWLREHLLRSLPEYMVPAAYVHMEMLPLNASGKLDRRALPAPDQSAYSRREYEVPRGEVEEILAGIWQELLNIERVGRNDSFFELGGHSLLALSLIERLRGKDMQMDLRALFTHADLAGLAATVHAGKQEPAALDRSPLLVLDQEQIQRIEAAVPGGAANVQDIYPLAPLQQGVLFHHLMQKRGDPYVLSSLLTFQSEPRLDEFLEALQAVIDRHDILRTALVWEGLPEPVQVVWRHAPLARRHVLLFSQDGAKELWERFDPRRHRLDVRRAPLFEAIEAYDAPQQRWLLLLLFHHLAVDYTSLEVIFAEVRAHLEGRQQHLPTPMPFRSFVAQALRTVPLCEHEAFFTAMLAGVEEPTAPFGLLDVQSDGSGILEAQQEIDADLAREIRACARVQRVSAASLYHLAWAQVLARLTQRADVVFGTVLFGRMQAGEATDRALGLFINTLPIRISVGEESSHEAVQATHERLVRLLRHEHASLVTAQRCSAVPAPTPLFTTVLNYRYSRTTAFEQQVLRSEERTNYPIALSVDDLGQGFRLTAQVHAALDPERLCRFMHRALEKLVRTLTEHSHQAIRSLDVLPESERLQLASWSAGQVSCPQERCLSELFEAQVQRSPQAQALVFEGQHATFAELNAAVNRLAHYLRARGVGPDVRVALCAEPSIEFVLGLLGILKAGGAYVPLDATYPQERLRYMLEDSRPALVLFHGRTHGRLGKVLTVPSVDLEADAALWRGQSPTNPSAVAVGLRSDHLAYIIYTSGSTGQPKGLMGEHRGMVNRIVAQRWIAPFAADDVCCHKTAMGFVDSIFEILGPLCYGRPLVLAPQLVRRDSLQLARLVQKEGITCLISVPSLAQAFLMSGAAKECLQGLRTWTLSGEELREDLLVSLRRAFPNCHFVNLYGSSEVAADATWYSAENFEGGRVPIGRPIHNTRVHVLDALSRPVPVGVTGEIHVGGVGVARGYLNRSELTMERFVRDRFAHEPDARLYRTGDLGRWRPDGMLEYLGRRDQQVKIRGFRVELGEIEAALRRHPGVSEAAVVEREDEPGEKCLVAYVVCRHSSTESAESLRAHLKELLPEYMVPSAFVVLESLPLTSNGKLDRRALPAPEQGAYGRRGYEAPRGEIEAILAGIWQEVLNIERVGRNDNFFELGGHSLSATRVMVEVHDVLGLELPLFEIFATASLEELAARTEELA